MAWNIGAAQNSGWDIGASQTTAATPPTGLSIPVAMHHYRQLFNNIVFTFNIMIAITIICKMDYQKRKLLLYSDKYSKERNQ